MGEDYSVHVDIIDLLTEAAVYLNTDPAVPTQAERDDLSNQIEGIIRKLEEF